MSYYVGNYKQDSPNYHGWLLGSFVAEGPRKTDAVEVKYWEFNPGPNDHPLKTSSIIECTLVLLGHTEALINNKIHQLQAGSYVVIQPDTPNNLMHNVKEFTTGITIKAPSDVTAKKVLETT